MTLKKIYKLILLTAPLLLSACSATTNTLKIVNSHPRSITISNITNKLDSLAYQTAEIHCAKYNKVPRILKHLTKINKEDVETKTMHFECVRP